MMPVRVPGQVVILAHRGGANEAPENTVASFEYTRSLGVRHIETDVHLSSDGQVVISHDPTVDRCYDGTGSIAHMTWRELSRLRHESGERMLLLSEALEAFPDMYFNIDAKIAGVEQPMLDVIAQHGATSRVLIASFNEQRLRRIRESAHLRAVTSLGTQAVARLVLSAKSATPVTSWRIPGPRQGVAAVQVPTTYGPVRVVDQRFVAQAHSAGLAVHVWTIDDVDEAFRLVEYGVDGLVTNRPRIMRDALAKRGLWSELPPPSSTVEHRPRD